MNNITARALIIHELNDDEVKKLHLLEDRLERSLGCWEIHERFKTPKRGAGDPILVQKLEAEVGQIHRQTRFENHEEITDLEWLHKTDLAVRAANLDFHGTAGQGGKGSLREQVLGTEKGA